MATVLKEPGAALNYDMSDASWYVEDRWQEPFRQMRELDPIHWTENGMFGNFWNVTSHKAIQHVEALPEIFSSSYEHGGITLADRIDDGTELVMPMFIAMDRPKHTGQRRTVAPAFTPTEMKRMSDDIRRRTAEILDGLPWDQPFDWVDKVSIELTTQMLAILFDFPWEDRRKLTEWSDWAGDIELVHSEELRQERLKHLYEMGAYFKKLWDAKINAEPTPDLISMMIHSDAMSEMDEFEFMGNLILLIVGGNDTTRNSMSGLVYGLQQFPDQREKLEQNPELIPNAVQEIIRWQTRLRICAAPRSRITTCSARPSRRATSSPCGTFRAIATRACSRMPTRSSSIARMRGDTSRSAMAFTAASARALPNCKSPSCSRKWPSAGCG